jgi:HEAT repeat protein
MRTRAVTLLVRSTSDAAAVAVVQAVTDENENVQRVALASIGKHVDQKTVGTVAGVLHDHESWAMRVLAAQALGRLGASGAGAEATRHLKDAALKEPYALVREVALRALASYDKGEAAQLATQMAAHDPEPRVRETATRVRAGR